MFINKDLKNGKEIHQNVNSDVSKAFILST